MNPRSRIAKSHAAAAGAMDRKRWPPVELEEDIVLNLDFR
jgi:hypothetical protein